MTAFIWFISGLVAGALAVWLVMRVRAAREESENRSEIARLNERLLRIPELEELCARRDEQLESAQSQFVDLSSTISELQTRLQEERKSAAEKLTLLLQAKESFQDTFKALSADALQHNNQSFLELASQNLAKFHESAKGEFEKREKAVDELVKPIRETLEKVDVKIENIEKLRTSTYATLAQQIKTLSETETQLRDETKNLVRALASPNVRGRWGEIQLRRVVEMAGMVEYCDFTEQDTQQSEDGGLRPDLIIRLPNDRKVVVDAKTPLHAYIAALEAPTDEVRRLKLKEHTQHIKNHLHKLSMKNYAEQYQPGIDFVVLFLPGEVFYNAALEQDPELIEYGIGRKVLIATPPSLIGLLKVIAHGWRQEALEENAKKISQLGTELYDRVRVLAGHFSDIRKGLDKAVGAYNNTVRSFESRVLVSTRKFKELSASASDEIPVLEQIERIPQSIEVEKIPEEAQPSLGSEEPEMVEENGGDVE
jgi:DNA recombination protein RmuC